VCHKGSLAIWAKCIFLGKNVRLSLNSENLLQKKESRNKINARNIELMVK
jgi:hypothetical protein